MSSSTAAAPNAVDQYAQEVVNGRILAGKYHRLACARHLTDRAREATPAFPYRFELDQAQRFFRFAERLKHYKGRQFAGKPIVLTPVQQFRLGSIFGWRHVETGLRRFTTAYNELPRKSGKSLEAAIVAIYVTFFEGEAAADGFCIATKRAQAEIVFYDAKRLVRSSGLKSRITVNAKSLYSEKTASSLKALGSDASTTDGLNPYLIITDELHAMRSRDLIDVMESATGARLSFLHFQITTAGNNPVSVCGDQHDYACKILDGVLEDDESTLSFFAFIAHADPEDDPWSETTWQKANPHWGISINPEDLRKLAAKAKHMPSAAAEFQQKRLNLWVNSDQPWLSLDGWRQGQRRDVTPREWRDELAGRPCYLGVDLSSKIDLTAVVALFPWGEDRWRVLVEAFTPEATLLDRAHRDRAPYRRWVEDGWLRTTPGNRIDYDRILDAIRELARRADVRAIGVDPWNAGNLVNDLQADGFQIVVEVPYTFAHMSAPSKDWEAEVLDGLVDANDNPLMTWCTSNAIALRDGKDNVMPSKKKSRGRIDPVVASIIARKLAGAPEMHSAYGDGQGLMVVGV